MDKQRTVLFQHSVNSRYTENSLILASKEQQRQSLALAFKSDAERTDKFSAVNTQRSVLFWYQRNSRDSLDLAFKSDTERTVKFSAVNTQRTVLFWHQINSRDGVLI